MRLPAINKNQEELMDPLKSGPAETTAEISTFLTNPQIRKTIWVSNNPCCNNTVLVCAATRGAR